MLPIPGTAVEVGWRAVSRTNLHWKFWDDYYVVYNSGSSHTHLLDPVAALLVHEITEDCRVTSEIIEHVAAQLHVELTEDQYQKLQQTLWQLDGLGLIEAVTP